MQQFVLLHVVYGKFTSQVSFSPRCLVADKTDKKKQRILRLKVSVLDFFFHLKCSLVSALPVYIIIATKQKPTTRSLGHEASDSRGK